MKRTIGLLTIAVTICLSHAVSEPSFASTPAAVDSIAVIRSRYATINKNLKRYKKIKKDVHGYSAEGGTLEAYLDGAAVKKIFATFFGEMGKAEEEYYFWNGKLIFVLRREFSYDTPMSGNVVSTKTDRLYFESDRMIRWIGETEKQVDASDPRYQEKQNEFLKNSREFVRLARAKG